MDKLSNRVRPNCEAAPWVADEIAAMEARIAELGAQLKKAKRDAILEAVEACESLTLDGRMCWSDALINYANTIGKE